MKTYVMKLPTGKKTISPSCTETRKSLGDSSNLNSPTIRAKSRIENRLKFLSPENKTLRMLKSRRNLPSYEIAPDLAAEVIKEYIIPMLKTDCKRKRAHKRAETFGISTPNPTKMAFTPFPGSPLEELILSEQISLEKKDIELKYQTAELKAREMKQEKLLVEEQLKKLTNLHSNLESDFKILNFSYQSSIADYNCKEQSQCLIKLQAEKYSKLYKELQSKVNDLMQALHDERLVNDIRLFLICSLTFQTELITNLLNTSISILFSY